MKIRQGFVSNSSSSSFLLVGYKAKKKDIKPQDYRAEIEKKYSAKVIKKYALDYFTDDDKVNVDDFDKFPPLFWKEMWKEKKGGTNRDEWSDGSTKHSLAEYDVPAGLKLLGNPDDDDGCEVAEEGFVGIKLGRGYESDITVAADKMIEAIQTVKNLAPKDAKISAVACQTYN